MSIMNFNASLEGNVWKGAVEVYSDCRNAAEGNEAINTECKVGQWYAFAPGLYYIYRGFLFFNTSTIPADAIILAATITLDFETDHTATNFNIILRSAESVGASTVVGDYHLAHYDGDNLGELTTNPPVVIADYLHFTLNALGIEHINIAGITKFVLLSEEDINSSPPSGEEYLVYDDLAGAIKLNLTLADLPTVTTQAVSNIGDVTAIGNGNITALGGVPTIKRGICWNTTGTPTVADSKTEEIGEFSVGAFTETLINLSPETHYYVRAYAMNAVGYSYGAEVEFTTEVVEYIGYGSNDGQGVDGGADSDGWVKFITAAEGEIPTGTRKVICSDYAGFTYRTQASETDDGAEYVAYFVISTDLTPDKSSLAYYKRILDLHLYFKNEISGMVKVEVKRDSEPAWQEVGEVTLTGIEEILIKHLAPDIKAKHFLFKLSATNKFKFLGCLYEFLLEGDR